MKPRITFPVVILMFIGYVSILAAQATPTEDKSGESSSQTIDVQPCAKNLLFQFDGTYYYSTVNCDYSNNCSELGCAVIEGYPSPVSTGCQTGVPGPCKCKNESVDPRVILDRAATEREPNQVAGAPKKEKANAYPMFPRNKTGLGIGVSSQRIVKVKGATGDEYYHCFCIGFNLATASGTERVRKCIAIPLDGPPDLDILNEGVDLAFRLKIDDGERKVVEGNSCVTVGAANYSLPYYPE